MGRTSGALLLAVLCAQGVAQAQDAPPAAPTGTTAVPVAIVPATDAPAIAPHTGHAKGDPWEKLNRSLFNSQQKFDRSFFRPVAFGYKRVVPKPVRTGIRHILSNISEPIVFLNDLLQLRPKHAVKTLARFLLNSTVGIAGLIDVAKTAKLPHRNNGFGNTLGRYGVGPGPYLFVPVLGPTNLRDLLGGQADNVIYPVVIGVPFNRIDYQVTTFVYSGLDLRVEADAQLKSLLDGAADPYATLRSVYLQDRAAAIAEIKGKPTEGLDDPLLDPEAPAEGAMPVTTDADPAAPAPDASPADASPADAAPPADPAAEPVPETAPVPVPAPVPPSAC